MPLNSSTELEKRRQTPKFLFLIAIFGLIFASGSVVAEDTDSSESADSVVEEENIDSDEPNEDEKTASSASTKEKTANNAASDQKASSDKAVVKGDKEKSDNSVAEEKEKKKNPETGSNLPNGDPAANVIRVTGDGIRDFFWQVEYLRNR